MTTNHHFTIAIRLHQIYIIIIALIIIIVVIDMNISFCIINVLIRSLRSICKSGISIDYF